MAREKRVLIHCFVIFHITAIFFWSQPFDYFPRKAINDVTGGYMRLVGLWQGWDMFSPNPKSILVRMHATVTRRDGTQEIWIFPQMDQFGFLERFQKERYRKWASDNLRLDENSALWEPTAKYIARQFADPNNPPVRVQLHRHWADIPVPTGSDRDLTELPFNHYTFYDLKLSDGDLR